ncbi:MAG: shikimate kinase [Candidatus Pacebacteria bacterium]|nr:shikimate kinase [Candidatus Paceibacterota bacterium]
MRGVTLIGMPGSGKSTIGQLLAQQLGLLFLDLDIYIAAQEKKKVAAIIGERGDTVLAQLEEKCALLVPLDDTVFSPGGSIVYSAKAMERAQSETDIIFLDVSLEEITKRLENAAERGIVGLREKSLEELYNERLPLYQEYADHTVNAIIPNSGSILREIRSKINR